MAYMLQEPWTIHDAIERGVSTRESEGKEVMYMDQNFCFAILRVKDGVASELVKGPFVPPPKRD